MTPPGRRARALLLAASVTLTTCTEPVTEVVVRVTSDIPEGACGLLTGARIRVSSDRQADTVTRAFTLGDTASGSLALPQELGLVPADDQSGQRLTIDVTAVSGRDDLFTRRAIVSYAHGRVARLDMFLARRCLIARGEPCPAGTTCGATGCEPQSRDALPDYQPPQPLAATAAPRLVAPRSTGAVTSARPVLQWTAPPSPDGFSVELCRDRDCRDPLGAPRVTAGRCLRVEEYDPAAPSQRVLQPGVVFWRVTTRSSRRTSATWQFSVGSPITDTGGASRYPATDVSWGASPDFNGDGYADALVASAEGGAARVYAGAPEGVALERVASVEASEAPPEGIGRASAVGDFNGDGYADVVVGAPVRTTPSAVTFAVWLGGSAGLSPSRSVTLRRPDARAINESAEQPASVAGAGDVDGDGYGDVIVGAPRERRAYVFFGGAGGDAPRRVGVLDAPDATTAFGASVATVGDLDADGYDDVAVGTGRAGSLHVFTGSAEGVASARRTEVLGSAPDGSPAPLGAGSFAVAAGDLNGDGYADFVVPSPDTGALATVYLFLGLPYLQGRALRPIGAVATPPDAVLVTEAGAAAGDFNGDGYADIALGYASPGRETGGLDFTYGGAIPGRHAPMRLSLAREVPTSLRGGGSYDSDARGDFLVATTESVGVFLGRARSPGFVEGPRLPVSGRAVLAEVLSPWSSTAGARRADALFTRPRGAAPRPARVPEATRHPRGA